jgi:GntR family transcriptional regulator
VSRVEEVVAELRRLIKGNQFEEMRLPSEPDLANQMGVSRNTIRQALGKLQMEGILFRKHGVGTFVNERILNIGTRLEEVWDFVEMIEVAGFSPSVNHVDLYLGHPAPDVADALNIPVEDEVLRTANVFLADDVPVIYCVDFIPAKLVRSAYADEELHGPVYKFLEKRCHQEVEHNLTEVIPIVVDKELSKYLQCQIGNPIHYFKETAFNDDEEPIMYSDEYYRPEYFSFNVLRKLKRK